MQLNLSAEIYEKIIQKIRDEITRVPDYHYILYSIR